MATMRAIVLAAACVCAYAFPMEPTVPLTRNTIFADEKLEGQIFENLEKFELLNAARNTADNSSAYRLPTTTKPSHYDVLWTIDIDRKIFAGLVQIYVYATQPDVNEIVIHSSEMNLTTVELYLNNAVINTDYDEEEETQFLRVKLADAAHTSLQYSETSPVIYTLAISFHAPLRTNMYGIYESWYRNNATDEVKWMASTQFQATAGRWAFPCYDEPSFKATFDVTIRRPVDLKSWFCTRRRSTNQTLEGYEDDIYHRTPIMSTYLLALIVADYEAQQHLSADGLVMYDVIARPGAMQANQSDYAFIVGMELLAEMSSHTAIDYYSVNPDLKMTQAAIPDFGAGAMENWGLLTYREAYLLYDEKHTNSYFKQLIAYILSHEIAHMWFGNLVTCDWWDVLWLNEGFARYYQYFLTNWVENYMGLETRFITEQMHTSLLSDSANNPHPLSTTSIGNRDSVSAMFSTLSYNKGAAIIRQTEHLLGFDVHREGLRNYLVAKAFQTALPIDLFESLQNVSVASNAISEYGSDFNVIDYYKSWTEQPGHPVLNVQVNHQTGEMTIYQRRFNINTGYSPINNNYIVPVTFATASNPDFDNTKPTHIIRKAVTTISRGSIGDEWVVFNKQQTGFYRVNYDDYTWDLIVATLRGPNRTQIHEYNRAQIVNDVFQFARSGLMTYTRAFNILSFLENETEYAPWVAALTGFSWIRNRLVGTTYLSQLNDLIMSWSNTTITQLNYMPQPEESFMTSYLRYQLAPTLCLIDAPNCRDSAREQFVTLRDGNDDDDAEVPVDNRNWVYCNALRQGTQADFTFLWNRFRAHNVYTEKIQLLMVLGCTPHAASLTTFLDAIVSTEEIIRPQDYTTAWSSAVSGNEANTQIVFNYVQNNLQAVISAFDGSATTPLSYISSRLRTVAEIDAFQAWATSVQDVLGVQYTAVFNNAEASRQSIQWANDVESDFINYFNVGDTPVTTSTAAPIVAPPVITIAPENLVEPSTPDLPDRDAAATTYVSMLVLTFAAMANFIF